ncbi:MAG TPA: MFS transporter [Terriglobales bacterium]|nr:MFS transporter [Terriglobales bacterium]
MNSPANSPATDVKAAGPGLPQAAALTEVERRVFAKIAWRLLPILAVGYVLNYLDRNNIGFAGLMMNREVGLSATQFGIGAGILFLGYCFFEVPSNLVLYRVGARVWLARIMITWGIISSATIFVVGPRSWYILRFLLGAAEAGFFPGVAFYLSTWVPAEYRTRMLAWFLVSIPLSSVIGGPVSGMLLEMHGIAGLSGWKWLFLLEGLPSVVIGIALLFILTDRPEQATWLTDEEKAMVQARIQSERREREVRHLLPALKDVRVLLLAAIQFGFILGSYGIGVWLPQMIKEGEISNFMVGMVSGGCYLLASIGMFLWAAQVDRSGRKIRNLTLTCLVSAMGLLLALVFHNFWLSLTCITVSLVGITAARAIFWTIPTRFLTGVAAAGGFAFINSIGTLGGSVGPVMIGWLKDRTGSFSAGLVGMAGFLLGSAALSASLKFFVKDE